MRLFLLILLLLSHSLAVADQATSSLAKARKSTRLLKPQMIQHELDGDWVGHVTFRRRLPQISVFGARSKSRVDYVNNLMLTDQRYANKRNRSQQGQVLSNVVDGVQVCRVNFVCDPTQSELLIAENPFTIEVVSPHFSVFLSHDTESVNQKSKTILQFKFESGDFGAAVS